MGIPWIRTHSRIGPGSISCRLVTDHPAVNPSSGAFQLFSFDKTWQSIAVEGSHSSWPRLDNLKTTEIRGNRPPRQQVGSLIHPGTPAT